MFLQVTLWGRIFRNDAGSLASGNRLDFSYSLAHFLVLLASHILQLLIKPQIILCAVLYLLFTITIMVLTGQ